LLSSGKDVVIVYHSYASVPGSEALKDYVQDLETGNKKEGRGMIQRLVFCCAFILPEGGSLMAALQFQDLPWFIVNVCPPQRLQTLAFSDKLCREMKSSPTHQRRFSTTTSQHQ
jgi:hypothetical protein